MKKYKQFINENQNDKILIIVDFQQEFSKFIPKNMLESIMEYCKNFNKVYQIWDSNNASKPSYTFPNEKIAIVKKFGTKFSEDLEKTIKNLNQKYPNAKEGELFEFDDVNSYVIKVNNNHGWFYIPEKMAQLFKSLKNKNVTLIGGAWTECIKDVFESMESFGIKVQYDKRYIYSAKNNNSQIFNPETQPNLI